MNSKFKKITILSLLTAVSLSLFAVELLIPPFAFAPSAKIGLANIVTLFMLTNRCVFCASDCFKVLIARCLLAALITGRIASILFSLTGGIIAVIGMFVIIKLIDDKHAVLISIIGAVFHNLGQMLAAFLIYGSFSILYYFPALFITGVLCGALTGLCVKTINKTKIIRKLKY